MAIPMPKGRPVVLRMFCEYSIDANGRADSSTSVQAWLTNTKDSAREIYNQSAPAHTGGLADWPESGTMAYVSGRLLPVARLFAELAPSLAASAIVESATLPAAERIEAVMARLIVEINVGGPLRHEWPVAVNFNAYQNVPPHWVLLRQVRSADDYLPEHWPEWSADMPERLDFKTKRFRSTVDSAGWRGLRGQLAAQYRPAIGALLAAVPHTKHA